MKRPAAWLALGLLAACARTEDASVNPGNETYNAVEQVASNEGDDQEVALGEWRNSLQEERQALEFGPQGTAPLLSIVCADRGGLILQRHGAVASGAAPMIAISVGGQGRQLPATAEAGTSPVLRASIPAGDSLLGQLGQAQGPITLRTGDGTPLVLPPSPLLGQFAQSCSQGTRIAEERRSPAEASNSAAPAEAASNQANAAAPAR